MFIEENPARPSFISVFVVFGILNLLDVGLTKIALDFLGAREVNPVMATMFNSGFFTALAFKLAAVGVVGLISLYLWRMDIVRNVMAGGVAIMTMVVGYQALGIAYSITLL